MAKPKVRLEFKNTQPELKNPKHRNANYNYEKQASPYDPMGQGNYANLPQEPKIMTFSHRHDYRDGIINNFAVSVREISNLEENDGYGND